MPQQRIVGVRQGVRRAGDGGGTRTARADGGGPLGVGQLILIGIGGIIGAGFFLGVGLPVRTAGPAVLGAFVLGGLLTAQVTGALTSIAVKHPVEGSFKVFADMYIGRFAGYMQGWIYYVTSVLTIASEAVAMGVFTRVWLAFLPLWALSAIYAGIILVINAFGVRNFGRVESLMSVVKIAALAGFIVFAAVAALRLVGGTMAAGGGSRRIATVSVGGLFPHGVSGLLESMLIVVFAYAGIGVFATAAAEVKDARKIETGALWTIVLLTALYLLSIAGLLLVVPWSEASTTTSPFVLGLQRGRVGILADLFNGGILVASFSVMAGAVFSANQVLVNLGQTRDAPRFVASHTKGGLAVGALAFTTVGIAAALLLAYLLPSSVYNFLISASSFMTFAYWFLMLWTFVAWRRTDEGRTSRVSALAFGQPVAAPLTMVVILVLTAYALAQSEQRIAFYVFAAITLVLALGYPVFARKRDVSA
ncbi:MAG: amino acid permease [Firmicutes bacterium]|nr:amino acid permease [Bacillota bacterium]